MQVPMTDVIAVRRFCWVDDPEHQLLVSIGEPQKAPGGTGEFYCPIQTEGFGNDEFVQPIYGIDEFQAIELALKYIGYRLSDINESSGSRLRWQVAGQTSELPTEWAQKK